MRNGQWVLYGAQERVGIAIGKPGAPVMEVHLVNKQGETTMVVPDVPTVALKPAQRKHIPLPRLKMASKESLDAFYPV